MKIAKRTSRFVLLGLLTFAFTFVLGVSVSRLLTRNTYCPRISPWQVLLSYENQDLQALDDESKRRVEAVVQSHIGKPYENILGRYAPALFRSMMNTNGEKRYVLVELAPLVFIPGSASLRIHTFDTTGRLLNAQEFDMGNRIAVKALRIRETGYFEQPLFIVDTEYCLGGHAASKYYALTGEGMELIFSEQDGLRTTTSQLPVLENK